MEKDIPKPENYRSYFSEVPHRNIQFVLTYLLFTAFSIDINNNIDNVLGVTLIL